MLFQNRKSERLNVSQSARAAMLLIASSVMTLTAFANPAMAQSCAEGGISHSADKQFSPVVGALTQGALDMANKRQYKAQLAALEQILYVPDLTPYESSVIYQMLGSTLYELNDYSGAVKAFEDAVNSGGLTGDECSALALNIAQLLIANAQYREGALRLEDYINQGNTVKPQYVDMLVSAWVQVEDYSRALPWAERWFAEANLKQRKHYDLLNFLYNNLGMGHKQLELREQMDAQFPDVTAGWDKP